MSVSFWTNDNTEQLYELRVNQGKTWPEIGEELRCSGDAARRKFSRVNWKHFFDDTEENTDPINRRSVWSQQDMLRLHTYLDSEKSYPFIAEKMERTVSSVERKAQNTDWKAWHAATFHANEKGEDEEAKSNEELIQHLVNAMVSLSRHNYCRIKEMRKDDFLERINLQEKDLPICFTEIKDLATQDLDEYGLGNEESIQLDEGTYIVVGDSHGKHTKRKMLDLINNVNDFFDADNVIHIGHILDDDNEISFKWGDVENLIVLAKTEELKFVHKKRFSHNFSYKIIREDINLGHDLTVSNQDMITDYVSTSIKNLDNEIFAGKMIVNCHRQEVVSKAASDGSSHFFMSPGSLCEKHIIRTIKQIDFQDRRTVKVAYHDGFSKYRKQKHKYEIWNQGILIVHVNEDGDHTVVPCLVQQINGEYYTSYFDKIISSKGVHEPSKKIFVTADMHAPSHDANVLDLQEQVCKDYKPDVLVNVGDFFDAKAINHHDLDKGHVIFGDYLNEGARTSYIMKRMAKWAKERHAITGNHERFAQDFIKKYPQLNSILNVEFICDLTNSGYEITYLKNVLEIGSAKFIHGDMTFYNQNGNKLEKASRSLGHNTFIGHIHYPSIRFGCYAVGFSGLMDQGYNEPEASAWIHGLGMCNQYNGKSWPTTIAIFNYKLILNGKTYEPVDPDSWNLGEFKARIEYDIEATDYLESKKPNR